MSKDFTYYASIAESLLQQALGDRRPQLLEHQRCIIAAADVYARLAAAAPVVKRPANQV